MREYDEKMIYFAQTWRVTYVVDLISQSDSEYSWTSKLYSVTVSEEQL